MRRLFGQGSKRAADKAAGAPTTTITVAKAWCVPSRFYLSKALPRYGVWFDAPAADTNVNVDKVTGIPAYQTAVITVRQKQAVWAEYLILSIKSQDGRPVFQVLSEPKDRRNADWAARRRGLPPPWDLKHGGSIQWIDGECATAAALQKSVRPEFDDPRPRATGGRRSPPRPPRRPTRPRRRK